MVLLGMASAAQAQESTRSYSGNMEFETGLMIPGYADVRIPGEGGTDFSLTDDLQADPRPFVRARLGARIARRHSIILLAAPLTFHSHGQFDRPVVFEGVQFRPDVPIEGSFTFNSYRLTYRYSFYRSERLDLALGLTAKIRDAAIGLRGGGASATKTNVGFVPIISFRASWWFAPPFGLLLDGDALAAPQGRAEDILTAVQARIHPAVVAYAGYRFLEGGSDVKQVYNFNLIHYAAIGASATF
jgi:hypothetical protein